MTTTQSLNTSPDRKGDLDRVFEDMRRQAVAAVEATIKQSYDLIVASSSDYYAAVDRMFGKERGRALMLAGNAAIEEAAKAECARHAGRRSHWDYDQNGHLAAVALWRAARDMGAREQ